MKILEIKNSLVKISYTSADRLVLGGFVIVEDSQIPYVAQVMSLKAESGINYAIVKLLFTFDAEGVVKNYNGTIPEMSSSITRLSAAELLDILPVEDALTVGKIAQDTFILNVDFSVLEKNLLICADKLENSNIMISNLAEQIVEKGRKTVIFDIDGTINAENRLTLGKDFKLPLNCDTINFIYENDLNDVNPTSKAIIQDVFLEVQEYANSVLDKFIPFDTFISVVDSQYKELGIPELALLKSRLLKYKEMGVFAQAASEFHSIIAAIRANSSTVINLAYADSDVQRLVMSTLYDEIANLDLFVYSFAKVTNDNSNKKLIRKIINKSKIYTTFITSHSYKYLYELKERAANLILFLPQTLQHDFAAYNIFLNKLNADECVIFGSETQNVPLILEVLPLAELQKPQAESEPEDAFSNEVMMKDDVPAQPLQQSEPEPEPAEENKPQPEEVPEASEPKPVEKEDELSLTTNSDSVQAEHEEPLTDLPELTAPHNVADTDSETKSEEEVEEVDEEEIASETLEVTTEEAIEDIPDDIEPANIETSAEDEMILEELPVLEHSEDIEEEIPTVEPEILNEELTELQEPPLQELPAEEEILSEDENGTDEQDIDSEQSIVETTDFFDNEFEDFTTDENSGTEEVEEETQTDELADDVEAQENTSFSGYDVVNASDTDFDEFQNDDSLPIYPVEESPIKEPTQDFQPGDRVSHPKYGEGVIEKFTRYGNKVLCSINFTNGRILIDPTISQLSKI